ncbi:MAG: DUF5686 family protein, partial [candidate division Zixibacteria bacterium]|nr:DUF5686 family protein [candidate division Zixibacteria bacterium]
MKDIKNNFTTKRIPVRTDGIMRIAFTLCLVISFVSELYGGVITGTVTNRENGEPVALTTVRVEGTGRSMLANEQGQYRLRLNPGSYRLRFSHVAHYSESFDINVNDSTIELNVTLRQATIVLPGTRVYIETYDPAQEIIIQAIAHKQEILAQIESYQFDAYTKLFVCDTSKDDSSSAELITETQLACYWQQPDQYSEVIMARRQSSNLQAEQNLVTVVEILNFNKNRIETGSYSIVSPTATDALDHYNYYLLDTIPYEGQSVFRLEIEPKDNAKPLFTGIIDIADSSFAIVGIEVTFTKGVETPYMEDFLYRLRYAHFEDEYWMPVEIGFTAIFDVPVPGFPVYFVDYIAVLHNYSFDIEFPAGIFDYVLEVDEKADDVDSAAWDAGQMIPLTSIEKRGYARIDSLQNIPKSIPQKVLGGISWLLGKTLFDKDFFHFNRVEGAYLGHSVYWHNLLPKTHIDLKAGYAFAIKQWQQRYGITYRLWDRRRLDIDLLYRDEIRHRPTINTPEEYNPTLMAVTNKTDQFDYYLEKGFKISAASDLLKQTRLQLSYHDFNQYSETNNTEYSMFRKSKKHRENPTITDGKLRSFSAAFTYDSGKLRKLKRRESRMLSFPLTQFSVGLEMASPDFVDNDFDFVRYYTHLRYTGRCPIPGFFSLNMYLGASEHELPPQKYFTVDFSSVYVSHSKVFKTLGENNFAGSRTAATYVSHNFRRWLFRKSGLPLIKKIPFSLSVYGGAFWTDFKNHPEQPGDETVMTAHKPYSEIGFALGRVPPIFLRLY